MNKCEHGHSIFLADKEVCKSVAMHFYLIDTIGMSVIVTARCEDHALLKDVSMKTTQLYTLTEITESEYDVFKVMDD